MNASAEFDVDNLKPTYNIILGVPGKSNAFAISEKLGLNESILKRAHLLINSDEIKIEDILKNIYDNKKKIELEKEQIENNLKEITNLKQELQQDRSFVIQKENEIINSAKFEARDIILKAKEEVTSIIREVTKISDSANIVKDLNNYRNTLNNSISGLKTSKPVSSYKNKLDINKLKIGTNVIINNINQKGTIISNIKNNKVQVQVGNSKLNVLVDNLSIDTAITNNKTSNSSVSSTAKLNIKDIPLEINVIGLTVDEAIPIVDKYIDDCLVSGLHSARIVHGKGTGKLRTSIHTFLKKNPRVKSFRLGTFGEGEMGVTILEIKHK